jgi:hypothetical protein
VSQPTLPIRSASRPATAPCSFPTCTSARAVARPTCCSTSCGIMTPTRSISWATSSTAGNCTRAGIGCKRTTMWCKHSCARRATARASSTSPAITDEVLRDYLGTHFGGIEVVECAVHEADGRCYLVVHGDLFDVVIRQARWLAHVGDHAYEIAIFVNRPFNGVRRMLGFTYWSLSQWAKLKVKNAVNFIGEFETVSQPRRADRASTASSAAISTMRRFATARSSTSTAAIGWKAARRSPSTRVVASRSSAGRCRPVDACRLSPLLPGRRPDATPP